MAGTSGKPRVGSHAPTAVASEAGEEGAADGYLLLPRAFQQSALGGDHASGRKTAARAADIGRRFGERDLVAMALNVEGRALIAEGRVREGLAALDEAMVSVVAGDVGAIVAGSVYCSMIEACDEVSELQRAHEWTAALTRWCGDQQGLVMFTGRCLVHRAMIRQHRGEWAEALDEAALACVRLADGPDRRATGAAHYRLGEVHRCRGDAVAAEDAYRSAAEWGRDPQPGLALLWFAQGRSKAGGRGDHPCARRGARVDRSSEVAARVRRGDGGVGSGFRSSAWR